MAGRERDVLALGSAVVPLPWFMVGLTPSLGGVVARLVTEAVAMVGKGLPVEDEVALAPIVACPCVRGLEVSCAACVSTLPASVDERLVLVVSEAGEVPEVEADGLGLGTLGARLCVLASAVTAPDPAIVTPGAEEGVEDASAVDGWNVAAKPASVVPLVLLRCRLGVAAEEPAGEEEEWLVAAELGLRDTEAAPPLAVPMPVVVTSGLIVGKVGLIASLLADTLSEVPSRAGVVSAVSVLLSPPTILVVEGVASDVAWRERDVLVFGSVILVFELCAARPVLLSCSLLVDPFMWF